MSGSRQAIGPAGSAMASPDPSHRAPASGHHAWGRLFAAWTVALASTAGALFIGEVMGQAPCHLCWHQRVFMFPLAVILAVATFREDSGIWRYALPVAALGWLVAAFHSMLYAGIISEAIKPCGQGPSCSSADMTILGLPLPYLSLAAFTAITILLIPVSRRKSNV
ncbi:disulfide bond formation protein B [Microvirga guangxiensis]|uniref:Disulfide bond formation protein DsbB n=1 Tax=Microvirga guangxiensis TaxID=549386 RepID=A0A1G5L6J4_9HYPH|nr:disulfide bond formation protein B [Microvirga guangxiensis]SCZ08573.1 disulfide bond formation protein DsbB [Microvirga guangxiensis]